MNFCTVGRISVSEIFESPKFPKMGGQFFAYKILFKISMFRSISCLGSPLLFSSVSAAGRVSALWDEFLYRGSNLCTVGRISVLREEFCTVGRISVLREEFLYCGKNFCTVGRISALREKSVLWEAFLHCGKNFCAVGRISVLRDELLYCGMNFCF